MIGRHSSRRAPLTGFLAERLTGARAYDRIAGYFRSSLLEVAGEALGQMAPGAVVRMVCNSELNPLDVLTARAAKQAQRREWTAALPEDIGPALRARLERLYDFLASGRLQVRVLPDRRFGLIHGKAGVIERADGARFCFLGSANESKSAWSLNYELVWTDDSPDGVQWVEEEFAALWNSPDAVELADAVVLDIERLTRRVVLPTVSDWRDAPAPDPAAPIIELPIYRRENGLWAHQKYFIRLAFDEHRRGGARFVLADQVGLGKTVQLGLAAKLMTLWGGGPVLALVPKPLMQQWQDELWRLLALPSAYWNGRQWVDEQGVVYADTGVDGLRRCPRRVGIVSTGLIVQGDEPARLLAALDYDCVILDEAHRARRRNLGPAHRNEKPEPNNLLRFLKQVSPRTRSLLLATATPVQLDPIEAWDLLDALEDKEERVLGSVFARWRTRPRPGLDLVLGREAPPADMAETWEWIRDPLPPVGEDRDFDIVRRSLNLGEDAVWVRSDVRDRLRPPDQARLRRFGERFFAQHNPYIRRIVRRTREFLEKERDPQTNEPYLQPVRVRLFGELDSEALTLPPFLRDAYEAAERFCEVLAERPGLNSGFLKTILLRRVGSTIEAGGRTARKMLGDAAPGDEEDDEGVEEQRSRSSIYPLTPEERAELLQFLALIEANQAEDPKGRDVERILLEGVQGTGPWIERGCILFSQYYDSAFWLAQRLSRRLAEEPVALYAGSTASGVMRSGAFTRLSRDAIKGIVQSGETRLLVGTDAASEGLNLQRLGTLINLDLPWNPTRLEQRKGRIQRIGQVRDEVFIYNMRYRGSVEDRVHDKLSDRLEAIRDMFGQVPDTLEDVWVAVALRNEERAREIIDMVPEAHPFAVKYDRVESVDWETCGQVLDSAAQMEALVRGW